MQNIWPWIASHWATWLLAFATWILGTLMGPLIKWFYPTRKDWKDAQSARIDKRIVHTLHPHGLAGGQFDSRQIAQRTSLNHDDVCDSLERLEAQGK